MHIVFQKIKAEQDSFACSIEVWLPVPRLIREEFEGETDLQKEIQNCKMTSA